MIARIFLWVRFERLKPRSTSETEARAEANATATAIDQSLRLRLYSGLRQSGSRFAAVIRRGAEAPLYLEAAANHEGMRVGSVCPSFARSGVLRMGSRDLW